ncbi:MAG: cytochrome c biogenesis protein CcsA [Myxococcota bacterium]|nr:cytochrome c biogenesis protein CcsA [Myxococcota bacterium]
MKRYFDWEHGLLLIGLALLGWGCSRGLFGVPAEVFMQEIFRIFFLHVPTAWNSLLIGTVAFVAAIGTLLTRSRRWDAFLEASVEVTLVLIIMVLIQGSIWGHGGTWGDTWWEWEPRLTASAVMALSFAGVLSLRSFLEQFDRRATWTAVATIVAYVDVPIVYLCVKWMPGLHQKQSTPETVSDIYHWPLRANAIAILLIAIWLIVRRARLTLARDAARADQPLPEAPQPGLIAGGD